MKNVPKSIVFITGTFVGNNCWDEWKLYFEHKGFKCIAPAWPSKNATPEVLRNRHPDSGIASNRLGDLTEYFIHIVRSLPEKPIVIGHSLGGLIVQLLVQRDLVAAGVAIHSFPADCLGLAKFFLLKTMWRAMGIFSSSSESYMISFKRWKQVVTNGMSCDEQKQSFYKYAIPESKQVVRDAIRCVAKIDFKKKHVPLLLISGSRDKLISASLTFNCYRKYKASDSITDIKDFNGRNHFVFGHPACKEEVDFIHYWLQDEK
jgi:pimeloyl-ACP methyl ester carboxylesterase